MDTPETFQYSPDLLGLLIEAVPKLCRTKPDLLLFFQGSGVSPALLAQYRQLLKTDREAFKKHIVTRKILKTLNELGDSALAQRREILKRVTEFEDFSVCWESDQAPARGLVAQIRDLVNRKDSFTRMNLERERERKERLQQKKAQDAAIENRKTKLVQAKAQFFSLFGEKDVHSVGRHWNVHSIPYSRLMGFLFAKPSQ